MNSKSLSWESIKADLDSWVCTCGEPVRSWTVHGDRSISGFGKREAPVDFECVAGHTWGDWLEIP